ncbi:T9SS type A sorting domain-containing protein [Hymenobacter negativus]|uniref:T9SS type A sorting domain-containing protein n=1 Tax=Hymenobacter negativus TaxID=2795026 RepID=A0ABS3QCH8_9BACT|nr:T9SS type A sorting domain-containing protein [Hymenobacter negativus]MBO2008529.1 T9SS type A sorting domain-containing protein [Hymenobacter negativus]
MKKLLLFVLASALGLATASAQTPAPTSAPATASAPAAPVKEEAILPSGVVAAPAPAIAPATTPSGTALIAPAPETPTANPNAIKVKAESAAGKLTVKTDNPGPTRVEVTDAGGRPVITHTMMNGQTAAILNVSQLPAGAYIVRCTAYEKTGMRRVMIGQ